MSLSPALARDIRVGLHQRDALSLVHDFYPEGMPEDWRANYLALMTQAIWVDEHAPDVAAMLLAIQAAPKPVVTVWAGAASSPVLNHWQQAHPEQPVIVLPPDAPIWSPQSDVQNARVGLIAASSQAAELRAWLEAFAAQAPQGLCAIFIAGDAPSVPTLDKAQTLIELLGW